MKRWWVLLALAIPLSYIAGAEWANADVCDQKMYDQIYAAIIKEALNSRLPAGQTFKTRNDSVEALRSLCKGQLSTYEKGTKRDNIH